MKNATRQKMLEKRKQLNPEDVKASSQKLVTKIYRYIQGLDVSIKRIAYYNPIHNEIDPNGILELMPDLIACYPRACESGYEMVDGIQDRVLEDLDEIDLWLVPGVAFDKAGNRLGFGKGIYDRLLKGTRGIKLGCAYTWQLVDALPVEAHDVGMDGVIVG